MPSAQDRAANILRPVYDRTGGVDRYVSLGVNPVLAHDAEGTIADARRLCAALDRPNVMIEVPVTPAQVTQADVQTLREAGLTDRAILDVAQVTAHFNFVNRLAEGLGVRLEDYWTRD